MLNLFNSPQDPYIHRNGLKSSLNFEFVRENNIFVFELEKTFLMLKFMRPCVNDGDDEAAGGGRRQAETRRVDRGWRVVDVELQIGEE